MLLCVGQVALIRSNVLYDAVSWRLLPCCIQHNAGWAMLVTLCKSLATCSVYGSCDAVWNQTAECILAASCDVSV